VAALVAACEAYETALGDLWEAHLADMQAAGMVCQAGLQAAWTAWTEFRTSPPALASLAAFLAAVAATLAATQAAIDTADLVYEAYTNAAWAGYQAEMNAVLVAAGVRKRKTA
jgi:hypothetical protein